MTEIDTEITKLQKLRTELSSLRDLECFSSSQPWDDSWPCEQEFLKRGGE